MLAASLALAACGQGENSPGPGGVTRGEARALDDAARMLDERRLPASALVIPGSGASPATTPSAQPSPSESARAAP
jgi:hypothetical protein